MSQRDDSRNDRGEHQPDSAPLTSHSYDGIQEYDNPMPAWWRRVFWGTFVFSLGYFVHYQLTGNGASVEQSYAEDMREFRELQAAQSLGDKVTEEGLMRLMNDATLMRDARTVFVARCVQCHNDRGQGNIGPNLTHFGSRLTLGAGLYPNLAAPQFSQYGGAVPAGYPLTISHTNASGTIWFTHTFLTKSHLSCTGTSLARLRRTPWLRI